MSATDFMSPRLESNRPNRRLTTVRDRATTVAATLLVVLAAFAAWRFYSEWRLGQVELTTDGPPLTVQVLPETGDQPLGEPIDVVSRYVLSLTAGEYRLKVNGKGRLGRTFRFAVDRGESIHHKLLYGFGTLAGLPVAIYAALIASSAFRRRWRRLVKLVGLTLLITVVIGAGWLWFDMRSMPAIEHYERSGWELAILVGAYAVGAGAILAWFGREWRGCFSAGRTTFRQRTPTTGSIGQTAHANPKHTSNARPATETSRPMRNDWGSYVKISR
jgi:hypothetical protein